MQYDIVRELGIRVIEVPDLDRAAVYVHGAGIGLVRSGLDAHSEHRAAAWLFAQALEARLPTTY